MLHGPRFAAEDRDDSASPDCRIHIGFFESR